MVDKTKADKTKKETCKVEDNTLASYWLYSIFFNFFIPVSAYTSVLFFYDDSNKVAALDALSAWVIITVLIAIFFLVLLALILPFVAVGILGTPMEEKFVIVAKKISKIPLCIIMIFMIYFHTYGNFINLRESIMGLFLILAQFLIDNFFVVIGIFGGALTLLNRFIKLEKARKFGIPAKMLHTTAKDISSVFISIFAVLVSGFVAPFIVAINFDIAIGLLLIPFFIAVSIGIIAIKVILTIKANIKTKCRTILSYGILAVIALIVFFGVTGAYLDISAAFTENRLLDYSNRLQTIEIFMQISDWTIWAILIHMVLLLRIEALAINSSILGEPTHLLGSKSMCMIVRRKDADYFLLGKHDHDQWIFMKCEVCDDEVLVYKESFIIDKLTSEDKVEVVWRKNIDTI